MLPQGLILNQDNVDKLEAFLQQTRKDVYSESQTEIHTVFGTAAVENFVKQYTVAGKILDVGCGCGFLMELFESKGFGCTGITLSEKDLEVCEEKNLEVYNMDQSFLNFQDETFGLVWCRHCLEHSIMPYFTLSEFYRVLTPGGYLYVEVPAPDTECQHQMNANHYSILPSSMWVSLIQRTGFSLLKKESIRFSAKTEDGQSKRDGFLVYVAQRALRREK